MNTIKAYTSEVVANDQGEWVDQEKLVVELTDVIGYSFGTNTFQAMFSDSEIQVFPLSRFDRIVILPVVVEDEVEPLDETKAEGESVH